MEKQGQYSKREIGDRSSILTTWMISYQQVAAESEEAAGFLKLWGFLDLEDLWYGLLLSIWNMNVDDKVSRWLAVLAESELEVDLAIRLLKRYSLIDAAD